MLRSIVQVSTDMVEPDHRSDYWRDVTRPLFECLPYEKTQTPALEGAYGTKLVGSLLTGYARFQPQRFIRDWRTISRSGLEDFYFIQLFTGSDAVAECGDRTLTISTGDVYIYDLGKPFTSRYNASTTYSLLLRRDQVEKATGYKNLHGTLFKANQPQTQLLSDVIIGIMKLDTGVTEDNPYSTENAAISVLALALSHNKPLSAENETSHMTILRNRVLDYIDTHLHDPALDIKMLMQRFKVSRAHLYRMFEPEGGIVRAIQQKRLTAAYQSLLRTPSLATPKLAANFGFSDSDQFQKKFRGQFGLTPNEVKYERNKLIVESGRLSDMHKYVSGYTFKKSA